MAKVLIVDSDVSILDELEQHLRTEHDVHRATDGAQATDIALEVQPDLIISDVLLDGVDGFALCQSLHHNPRTSSAAIILTTSQPLASEKVRALNNGADDYLSKPFDWEVFDAHVQAVLRRATQMKDVSPLTKLPGRYRINTEIDRLVSSQGQYAVIECDVTNFKSYNDKYGFSRGDEVIKFLGSIVADVAHEYAGSPNVVGHLGGDDFVIISSPSAVQEICEHLIERFDRGISNFYDDGDVANGYIEVENRKKEVIQHPICTLAVGVVSTEFHDITSQWEASVTAAEMRVYAKKNQHSSYEIDRRRTDDQFAAMLDGGDRRQAKDDFQAMIDGDA